jgi:hypothetical protein
LCLRAVAVDDWPLEDTVGPYGARQAVRQVNRAFLHAGRNEVLAEAIADYSVSSRTRSRLRNAGGESQRADRRSATCCVSGRSEFAIAAS